VIAFLSSYAQKTLKMDASPVRLATLLASFGWLIFTLFGGALSDRIGRVRTFQLGYVLIFAWVIPMFLLVDTRNIWAYGVGIFVLTVGLGLSYGPMSAMYAEMFPASVRYSGGENRLRPGFFHPRRSLRAANRRSAAEGHRLVGLYRDLHHGPVRHLLHWRQPGEGNEGGSAGR